MKAGLAAGHPGRASAGIDWPLAGFVSAVGVVLIALTVLTEGNVAVIAAPLLLMGALVLIWRIPLRYSIFTLLFLNITMEAPYECFAEYVFRTPLYPIGMALLANLNVLTGIKALSVSGTDLLVFYLFIIFVHRRATRSTIDGPLTPTAPPMLWAAALSMAVAVTMLAYGLATGGSFNNSLWQVQKILYIPIFFALAQGSLRGTADLRALGKILAWAAVYRALLAVFIYYTVRPEGHPLVCCTTHADTILFVDGLALMVIFWNERVKPRQRWLYAAAMLIIVAGIVVNNRRIAWVSFTGALIAIAAISPWTSFKRKIARAILIGLPFLVAYVAVGWNSGGKFFKPAQMVRSVVDSKSDGSSQWRDLENYNLTVNIGMHPWFGVGYGHEYEEIIKLPDVSIAYPQFRYIPHNSVLATWAFLGVFGFTGLWTMLVMLVFLAARSYHRTAVPAERAAAMMCIVAVIVYINEVYGDIGVSLWLGPMTIAPAMVVAGKLATSTGAWPSRAHSAPPEPPRSSVVPLEPVPFTLPGTGASS